MAETKINTPDQLDDIDFMETESDAIVDTSPSRFVYMISGALIGAGLMFLFDPRAGRRRRARIFDSVGRVREGAVGYASSTLRDFTDRVTSPIQRVSSQVSEAGKSIASEAREYMQH